MRAKGRVISHNEVSKKKRSVDPCIRVGRLAVHSVDKQAIEGAWRILKSIIMVLDIRVTHLRNIVGAYSQPGAYLSERARSDS